MSRGWRDIQIVTTKPLTDGDRVVLDVHREASSGPIGLSVTSDVTASFTVRAGLITHFKLFRHRADALRAAGLSE